MSVTTVDDLLAGLHWLGHDSFRIEGPPVIYLDPWKLGGEPPTADLILISHDHFDHCSPEDVEKVRGTDTVVLANESAAGTIPGARMMRPGAKTEAAGVTVEAVHAYNTNKFRAPGQPFHPRSKGHVGWVVTLGGVRLYFAGDTDCIPEMAHIACDVALLPVSGTYVMTVDEAVLAADTLKAQVVVPMHYGSGIGTDEDGDRFARAYSGRAAVLQVG